MKRGLLTPALIRESHDCAIALRRRLRGSLVTYLFQAPRDPAVAKEAAQPCEESSHAPVCFFVRAL